MIIQLKSHIIVALVAILASGCAQRVSQLDDVSSAHGLYRSMEVRRVTGRQVVDELTSRYNSTVQDCGNPGRPAFLCSGVVLRGVITSDMYLSWDPSPASIRSGGVSFSWLRADNNFAKLAYGYVNGYFFYPVMSTPPGKDDNIEVLCAFVSDGSTDGRSLQGCGPHPDYPNLSVPCNEQEIDTLDKWLIHYNGLVNKYSGQCGWNVRDDAWDQAGRFNVAIMARSQIADTLWRTQNELRLATWQTGSGATLPIQAFFYIEGSERGLADAKIDQERYYGLYSQAVPIIKLKLPANKSEKASFSFETKDQMVDISLLIDMD